jgi:hypothetical protein
MIHSALPPALAPPRTSLSGTAPAGAPETFRPADDDTDPGAEATIAMCCPPFEWLDPDIGVAPAPPPAGEQQEVRDRRPAVAPVPARVEVPWADRRMADRLPVRPGARAEIRRWGGGAGGPDVAEELLNVSEAGVGVRLSVPVRRGERFDVTLWGPGAEWCGRGMGVVRWAVVFGRGTVLAGLQLNRPLVAEALHELTAEPAAEKSACPPAAPSRR